MRTSAGPPDPHRSGSQPELSLVHEIGHFIDYSGLPGKSFDSTKPSWRRMQLLMREIRRTPTYQSIAAAARAGGRGVTYWGICATATSSSRARIRSTSLGAAATR